MYLMLLHQTSPRSGGTILVTEKPEGSLTDETFEDRECARRATSSVHSPCLVSKFHYS